MDLLLRVIFSLSVTRQLILYHGFIRIIGINIVCTCTLFNEIFLLYLLYLLMLVLVKRLNAQIVQVTTRQMSGKTVGPLKTTNKNV